MGPTRLTSAYYNVNDDPILVADVPADEEWQSRTLARMLEDQPVCRDWLQADEDAPPCNEIIPSFLANMHKVLEASETKLNRSIKLGYVIIPHKMRDYIPFMDEAMHHVFNFVHNPQPDDDLIEYDVFELAVGIQYGYNLVDPQDRWALRDFGPWSQEPFVPPFREDDHMIYINVEDSFLEIGYRCLNVDCLAPAVRKVVPNIRESSAMTQDPNHATRKDTGCSYLGFPPLSLEFSDIITEIAHHITDFVTKNPYISGENGKLRYVALAGGASSDLIIAATMAMPYAFPGADTEMFLTTRDPAFVPSLGAAQMMRSIMINDRRFQELA